MAFRTRLTEQLGIAHPVPQAPMGGTTWALAERPERLDVALDHKPAALMLSFGDASPFILRIKAAGIPVICQIQSLARAREVLAQGTDVIVAQGLEASGHGAQRATLPLVPAVVDLVAAAADHQGIVARRVPALRHPVAIEERHGCARIIGPCLDPQGGASAGGNDRGHDVLIRRPRDLTNRA